MRRTRALLAAASLVAASACVERMVGPDPDATPSSVFDIVWSDFDRNYASFGLKQIDWNAVRARYAPMAAAASSVDALAPVIGAMFRELRDPHVDLMLPGNRFFFSVDPLANRTYFNPSTILTSYVGPTTMTPSRMMRYGKLAPDIGWIWIGSFGGSGWADEIDGVLTALGNVSAVVIDVRNNGGGSTNNAEPIAARFFDQTRTYGYFQYRNGPRHDDFTEMRALSIAPKGVRFTGRVVVLTNRRCVSTTESFVLSLRVVPGVQVVGDTTAGGLGNPMMRELPNGWLYRLPQWILYDVDRRAHEGIGVAPDVVVRMTAADSTAQRDLQLERALVLARGASAP